MKRCLAALVGLLAVMFVTGLLATVGWADTPPPGGSLVSPTEGTVVIEGPSYIIPVEWSAGCPLPNGTELRYHHWSVDILVTRTRDATVVGTQSIEYVGVNDSSNNPHTQGMVVTLAPGVQSETFNVRVSVACYPYASTVIGSRSVTVTLQKPCDPNLLAKALREYDTATSFANAGVKELTEAAGDLKEFRDDYVIESAKVGAEKLALLQVLHALDAGYELDLAQLAEVTGFYVGIGVLIEETTFKFYPIFKAYRGLTKDAEADFNRAKDWTARADADLAQALAQGPCLGPLEKQLNKLLADQEKKDAARDLIDSWENNGGTKYLSPINREVLDEQAALKLARDIISGKVRTLQSAEGKPTIKPTAKQARAALNALNRAIALHAKAASKLAHVSNANATLLKRLRPLLKN